MMTAFGSVITGTQVRAAAESTIRAWFPDYIAEAAQISGRDRDTLPTFRSYVPMLDMDKFDEQQLPACVIVAPGLVQVPYRHEMLYDGAWALGIGTVVSGQDERNTLELVELYAAAVRALILQHASLGGFADGVLWETERYDELDTNDQRTIAAGIVQFTVHVSNVVDVSQGPTIPSLDATVEPDDWPTAQTVDIATTA